MCAAEEAQVLLVQLELQLRQNRSAGASSSRAMLTRRGANSQPTVFVGEPSQAFAAQPQLYTNARLPSNVTTGPSLPTEIELELPTQALDLPVKAKWVLALLELLGLGCCGVDRCYMGQGALGFVKGFTVGGCGIWFFIDYVAVMVNCLSLASEIQAVGYRAGFSTPDLNIALVLAVLSIVLAVATVIQSSLALGSYMKPQSHSGAERALALEEATSTTALSRGDVDETATEEEHRERNDGEDRFAEFGGPVPASMLFAFANPQELSLYCLGCCAAAVHGFAYPLLALLFGRLVREEARTAFSGEVDVRGTAWFAGLLGLGIAISGFTQGVCFSAFTNRMTAKLRPLYFRALLYRDIAWFDTHDVASLPREMDDDLEAYKAGLGLNLGVSIMAFSTIIGCYIIAFVLSWRITLIATISVPATGMGVLLVGQAIRNVGQERQVAYNRAARIVNEVLLAIRTISAFGGELQELLRYETAVEAARRGGVFHRTKIGLSLAWVMTSFMLAIAMTSYCTMRLVHDGAMPLKSGEYTVDSVVTPLLEVMLASFALGSLTPGLAAFEEARVHMARFFYIIEHQGTIHRHLSDDRLICVGIDTLELRDVHFSYPTDPPEQKILKGANLQIRRGQKVAIVGESGSGKSTVMALLERFYDPSSGLVLVNGEDLRQYAVASYRAHIGFVGQEPVLFATSVRENILQGSPTATMSEVYRAAKHANLKFIDRLPEKFDTFVGAGGSQFSGGQKQRIALARALVKKPSLLFLDEATSALDSTSERIIQDTIDYIGSSSGLGMTILSIAHRLTTVKNSDVIFVMSDGKVVQQGQHSELIAQPGLYAALAAAQAMDVEEVVAEEADSEKEGDALPHMQSPAKSLKTLPHADSAKLLSEEELEQLRIEDIASTYSVPTCRLLQFCRTEWWVFLPGLLGATASGASTPLAAYAYVDVIMAFVHSATPDTKVDLETDVGHACLLLSLFAVMKLLGGVLQHVCFAILGEGLTKRCRVEMLASIFNQEVGFHDDPENTPPRLAAKMQLLAYRVSVVCTAVGERADAFVALAIGSSIACYKQWRLSLVAMAASCVCAGARFLKSKLQYSGVAKEKAAVREVSQVVSDSLSGAKIVHAAGGAEKAVELCARLSRGARTPLIFDLGVGVLRGFSDAALFWALAAGFTYMAHLRNAGEIEFDRCLVAFLTMVFAAVQAIAAFTFAGDYGKCEVAAHDMFELIDRDSLIPSMEPLSREALKEGDQIGRIEFVDVTFRYPWRLDVQVLQSISFTIQPGQSVGLCGPSGGGKSTLLSLIQRFYDPGEGQLLVGASRTPLKEIDVRWWRKQIGFVGQEPVLFNTTILENIEYGLGSGEILTEDRLEEINQMAHLDFVGVSALGWDTIAGRGGSKLSGGQKQRVAIARALARDPAVLLLDEATSSLDSASEMVVSKALKAASRGRTSVMIAHRISTIQGCNPILVFAAGRVLEAGSHTELMELDGVYSMLQDHQTGTGQPISRWTDSLSSLVTPSALVTPSTLVTP